MKSPFYCSGWLYRAGMHVFHGKALAEKYACICGLIKPGECVLDVGCGTGTLQSHLKENGYVGLEMNDDFIRYAKKKGRTVLKQDALAYEGFDDFDVCVMMDVLHHVNPRHRELVERALSGVRGRVIVSEPYEVKGRNGIVKTAIKLIDADGVNDAEEWMTKDELLAFYRALDASRVIELPGSLIAVFDANLRRRQAFK